MVPVTDAIVVIKLVASTPRSNDCAGVCGGANPVKLPDRLVVFPVELKMQRDELQTKNLFEPVTADAESRDPNWSLGATCLYTKKV